MRFFGLGIFFLILSIASFQVVANDQEKPVTEVELTHWWKSGGERAALDEIRQAVEARDAKFIDTAIDDYDLLRARIVDRLSQGYPPAMTQWLAGNDLLELSSIDAIQDAPSLWRGDKLEDILFPEVLANISRNGKISGIPVGIHIQNTAFYNGDIYRKLNLEIPETWSQFLDQAKKIKAAGYTAIALSDEPWQLRFIFNTMLMEQLGVEQFQQFYEESLPIAHWKEILHSTLDQFFQLHDYVDAGHKKRLWNEATTEVIEGRAAMQVMGDFAKGEMLFAGKKAGEDFLCALAPGAGGTMIYAMDGFVMLKVTKPFLKEGQDLLFDVVLDPAVQAAFNSKKGGIPVRFGVDTNSLDSCSKQRYQAWISDKKNNIRLPDTSSRLRLSFVQNVLHEAWVSGNHDPEIVAGQLIKVVDEALSKSKNN